MVVTAVLPHYCDFKVAVRHNLDLSVIMIIDLSTLLMYYAGKS